MKRKIITTIVESKGAPSITKKTRTLTDGQKAALEDMKTLGTNIFITGQAGTGKSYIIREYVNWCKTVERKCAITSTTGISACLIGGTTLHAWAGIGLGEEDPKMLLAKVVKNKRAVKRWKKVDTLIIDEVSMLKPSLLEKLDYIGMQIRGLCSPLGGIQLILCGDFAQLPPIESDFLFKVEIWNRCVTKIHCLQENIRQTDPVFQKLLAEVRLGKVTETTKDILLSCLSRKAEEDIKPTKIYPKKVDVEKINRKRLIDLKKKGAESKIFKADDQIVSKFSSVRLADRVKTDYLNRADKMFQVPAILELCIGAQVILTTNHDVGGGLCNGSRGVIRDFRDGLPSVLFRNGITVPMAHKTTKYKIDENVTVTRSQIPLILGFASTVHKSQGSTLDCASVDLGPNVFENGQAYTALSRVRSLDSLFVECIDFSRISARKDVVEFYEKLIPGKEKITSFFPIKK